MRQRWTVFLAALAGTVVLVAGVTVVADRVFSAAAPAPRLSTIPTSTLSRAGYTLAPASTPPYCGIQQAVASRGWMAGGSAGCPITEAAATDSTPDAAQETLLARVTSRVANGIGRDHLMWLVVMRPGRVMQPMIRCASTVSGPPCPPAPAPNSLRSVVFEDAYTGKVMAIVAVGASGPIVPRPVPLPVPVPLPTFGGTGVPGGSGGPGGPGVPGGPGGTGGSGGSENGKIQPVPFPVTPITPPGPVQTEAPGSA